MSGDSGDGRRRKVAAHRVLNGDEALRMAVVEIADGAVVDIRQLVGEQPSTEWLGGDITLRRDADGILRAFHCGRLLK